MGEPRGDNTNCRLELGRKASYQFADRSMRSRCASPGKGAATGRSVQPQRDTQIFQLRFNRRCQAPVLNQPAMEFLFRMRAV